MKIQIKGKEVELKYSFRINMMYENAVGSSFTGTKGITESIFFFWCTVVYSSGDQELTLEEFIDWCDDNKDELVNFGKWLVTVMNNQQSVKKNSKKTVKVTK